MHDSINEENIRSIRKEKRGEKKERMVSGSDISYYASRGKEKGALRRRDGLSGFSGNFQNHSVTWYKEFVEDVGQKYMVQEQEIRKTMGEDEIWLPW